MEELQLRLVAGGGVLTRRENRDLAGTIDRLLRRGELVALFAGVYVPAQRLDDPLVRIRAAAAWAGPDGVITRLAAARLTFWPTARPGTVTLALPDRRRLVAGVDVEQRRVPPELVLAAGPVACTHPSLTAVDLADGPDGGCAIDEVLRTRAATLPQLWRAFELQPNRRGNRARKALLRDSRDLPWSEAERLAHRLLRSAHITGWRTNQRVLGYCVDILFAAQRVVIEVDGWEYHSTRSAFERDRRRRNDLTLAGYTVLTFTFRQLTEEPDEVVRMIRCALGR